MTSDTKAKPEDVVSNHDSVKIRHDLLDNQTNFGDDIPLQLERSDVDSTIIVMSFGHGAYRVDVSTGKIKSMMLAAGSRRVGQQMDIQPFIGIVDPDSGHLIERESLRQPGQERSSLALFGDHIMESGVHIIDGPPETGKTTLMCDIAKQLDKLKIPFELIRFSEPDAVDLELSSGYKRYAPTAHEPSVLVRMASALLSDSKVILWDSLKRYLFSGTGGATGKGGVQMGVFDYLSAWSALAVELDKIIIFTTNPLSNAADEDFMAAYKIALSGSVEGVVMLTAKGQCSAISRTTRQWKQYTFTRSDTNSILRATMDNDTTPVDEVCYIAADCGVSEMISRMRRMRNRLDGD